jgi:membrane protein implicated in regulation of membrane protease activity
MSIDTEVSTQQRRRAVPRVFIVLGIALILVLVVAAAVGVLWLARSYPTEIETIRDVFIIALALESCVFGLVLMVMLVMVIRLVNTVEFEIKPILRQTNQTMGSVRGTTAFVSKHVVDPVVKTKGYASAVRQGIKALFGDPRRNLPD